MTNYPVTTATGADVRVRFCPSPTGTPHVGLVRTALFNWAYARHTGGTFIFRIEDTDAARDTQESYDQIVEALTWLGLTWDEGINVGGPNAPYRQSERMDIYRDVVQKLIATGHVYESFSTPEEIEARNLAAGRDPKVGYDNSDRNLTDAQKEAFRAEGRVPALRLRVPDEDITFDDLVRGEITFPAGSFRTLLSYARMATRSTRWSTRSMTPSCASLTCCAEKTCSRRRLDKLRCITRSSMRAWPRTSRVLVICPT